MLGYAFNDIIVERSGPHAARFDLDIDHTRGTFVGDGVIFATPLGSTAYSLAAGGPIIDSRAQDLCVVTPNNPHISPLYSSLQRPHVLTKHRRVTIKVRPDDAEERPLQLTIDGQVALAHMTSPVEIFVSRQSVKLLQLEDNGFHDLIDARRLGHS
jgi:NAD+ kinase